MHFTVREPSSAETPVVVEIPHAGLHVPPQFLPPIVAPARALGRDADLFVDRLYDGAAAEGATSIVAHVSRFAVDLNRAETDIDADAVEGAPSQPRAPRGLIWRLASDGSNVLARPLTRADFEARLAEVYRPYHAELRRIIDHKVAQFGFAVVLAAHSMPSPGKGPVSAPTASRTARDERESSGADVVPGTRGRTSAAPCFIDAVDAHARAQGWTVVHDDPYKGGFTTQHYGRPSANVHAVQVELARRLYMNEALLTPDGATFETVRAWCRALVAKLGSVRPPG